MSTEPEAPEAGQPKPRAVDAAEPAASEVSSSSATPADSASATPADSASATPAGSASAEEKSRLDAADAVEVEAESIRPPPPMSLRPKVAKDVTTPPIGVTAQLPAPVWPPRTVADLMTRKIITVGENEAIGNLEALMEKFRFRHLPVVGDGMKFVGLISRTDLLHAELGRKPDGTLAPKVDGETLAGVIMNRNIVFAQLDTPLVTVGRLFVDKRLTCLPIVLEDHTLVGILTASDFVRLAVELLEPRKK